MSDFIKYGRSIIPACDVSSLTHLARIADGTAHIPGITAYKVGIDLVIRFGLAQPIRIIREYSPTALVIYDHQKAGNDIPAMGKKFADAVKASGADAAILFPFAGPATEKAWITACEKAELVVLVGSHMTHEEFIAEQGGFIPLDQLERVYDIAVDCGITDFVVPGNQTDMVRKYRDRIGKRIGSDDFRLYAPGFVTQGGKISEAGEAAGEKWHAIVGTAIYDHEHTRQIYEAARQLTAEITQSAS
ncbi:MAG: orotidine 5'-phosphate decarboxylase / HUMPS family protein [Patescibacteria group bacterium]